MSDNSEKLLQLFTRALSKDVDEASRNALFSQGEYMGHTYRISIDDSTLCIHHNPGREPIFKIQGDTIPLEAAESFVDEAGYLNGDPLAELASSAVEHGWDVRVTRGGPDVRLKAECRGTEGQYITYVRGASEGDLLTLTVDGEYVARSEILDIIIGAS